MGFRRRFFGCSNVCLNCGPIVTPLLTLHKTATNYPPIVRLGSLRFYDTLFADVVACQHNGDNVFYGHFIPNIPIVKIIY